MLTSDEVEMLKLLLEHEGESTFEIARLLESGILPNWSNGITGLLDKLETIEKILDEKPLNIAKHDDYPEAESEREAFSGYGNKLPFSNCSDSESEDANDKMPEKVPTLASSFSNEYTDGITAIDNLPLKEPTIRRLKMNGITTVEALTSLTEDDLMAIPGMGEAKRNQVIRALDEFNLSLECPPVAPLPETLEEWLSAIDVRESSMLIQRFNGKTLQEIADGEGITRERVRQITDRALQKRPRLDEDTFQYLVDTYVLTPDRFSIITELDPIVYGYLRVSSNVRREDLKPLVDALNDSFIPDSIKKKIEESGDGESIFVDNEVIRINKRAIVDHLVKIHATDEPISVQELLKLYIKFLTDNHLDAKGSLDPVNERAFRAFLERGEMTLFAPRPKSFGDGEIRAYYKAEYDYSGLCDFLLSGKYMNVELSTKKLFEDPDLKEILESLNIIDEYELHVILRDLFKDSDEVTMQRTPVLTIGKASRDDQVLALIQKLGPATEREIAEAYEALYGIDSSVVRGSFFINFSEYRHDGKLVATPIAEQEGVSPTFRTPQLGELFDN